MKDKKKISVLLSPINENLIKAQFHFITNSRVQRRKFPWARMGEILLA
jgi:hypothetical protein